MHTYLLQLRLLRSLILLRLLRLSAEGLSSELDKAGSFSGLV